jgi:DsbC/DsbD-like thiol-disulfide interchange protein
MMDHRPARLAAAIVLVASVYVPAGAQMKRPRAEVTPVVETSPVTAGAGVRLSLRVKLPADVHVQADKPRDPSLIPTILTVTPPPGVTVERVVYPPPADLAQAGRSEPLAVLGPEFTIEVSLALAADTPAGELVVPARLRYQACDASLCYPPATADTRWALQVAGRAPARE